MNKYRYFYFVWLLPLYFLLMGTYQLKVYQGISHTFDNGASYVADVIDFDVKQIAAQTSGYVVLSFNVTENQNIQQKLSLPVQMAQVIMESSRIPIRYQPDSFNPIVIISTYDLQRHVVWLNSIVSLFGLLATIVIAGIATRFANRNIKNGEEEIFIERMDSDDS